MGPAQPYVTITAALAMASDGDTIEVEAGDYPETLQIDIDVEIIGLGGLAGTSLSGVGAPAVEVDDAVVSLTGFTLNPTATRGIVVYNGAEFTGTDLDISGFILGYQSGPALACVGAMATLVDVTMDGNSTGGDGGTLAFTGSIVTLTRVTITNSASGQDGTVWVDDSDVLVDDSTFTGNAVDDDGGVFDIDDGSGLIITASTFANNSAVDGGGAIRATTNSDVAVIDCTFDGNVATGGGSSSGGAIRMIDSDLTASGNAFIGNLADVNGGALRLEGGNHTLSGNTFSDNVSTTGFGGAIANGGGADLVIDGDSYDNNAADFGGAVYATSFGDLDVMNAIFTANVSVERGGAIRWRPTGGGSSMFATLSSFDENTANTTGGAIAIFDASGGAQFSAVGNRFTANGSAEGGGALYIEDFDDIYAEANLFCGNVSALEGGAAFVNNSGNDNNDWFGNLFVDNTSIDTGGALAFDNANQPQVINNTFAGNSAGGGGHIGSVSTDVDLINNVFADAAAGDGVHQSNSRGTRDYNLWFNNTTNDVGDALNAGDLGGNAVFADPEFVAWTDDGDCTNDDFHLAGGSAGIDAGDPGITDRDGSPSDIGAFGGPNALPSDNDGDGFNDLEDCDDTDAAIHPDATEICDGIDNNCDGSTDGADAAGAVPWYDDDDGDGYGDSDSEEIACYDPGGMIPDGGDCDDNDVDIHPGAVEICDGIDQDCDGLIDDGVQTAWYEDADGDGFGGGPILLFDCFGGSGLVAGGDDCDDGDPAIHPGATEVCDNLDNNCDGDVDEGLEEVWYEDNDDDGFGVWDSTVWDCEDVDGYSQQAGDCDDDDDTIYPGAEEVEGDAIDQDCDGVADGATEGISAGKQDKGDSGCGCDSATSSSGWWLIIGALLCIRRRKGLTVHKA